MCVVFFVFDSVVKVLLDLRLSDVQGTNFIKKIMAKTVAAIVVMMKRIVSV